MVFRRKILPYMSTKAIKRNLSWNIKLEESVGDFKWVLYATFYFYQKTTIANVHYGCGYATVRAGIALIKPDEDNPWIKN